MSPPQQLDLFTSVLHAYAQPDGGALLNKDLYRIAAATAGVSDEEVAQAQAFGASESKHNLFARKVRWYQQSLKQAGILERVEGERGFWRLTQPATKDLSRVEPTVSVVGFSTELGIAILGSCESVFARLEAPITLVVTSPPYPLANARKYGNPPEHLYVDWICKTLEPVVKNLVPGGSICLNVSNDIFMTKSPARSLYLERLVLALHDRLGLELMDRLIWRNKSKPPGPYQYASKARTQLNVEYEPVYWFTNDPQKVKSDNRRVLQAHSERHLALIAAGGENRRVLSSDNAYSIRPGSYGKETAGRIPRNVLEYGHRCASQAAYKRAAQAQGLPVHGAPMPLSLAKFLIEFLSAPNDLVADPFSGSFTTAVAAQQLGRRWLATECVAEYVLGGALRFEKEEGFANHLMTAAWQRARDSARTASTRSFADSLLLS